MDDESPGGQDHRVVMSFLDVMSSGLGASILLFIVFSVLPHFGDSAAGGRSAPARSAIAAAAPSTADASATGGISPGAAAEDVLAALAKTSIVLIEVEILGLDCGRADGRFVPLPKLAEQAFDKVPGGEPHAWYLAVSPKGIPPSPRVGFAFHPPRRSAFDADVSVRVGGLAARRLRFHVTPAPAGTGWKLEPSPSPAKGPTSFEASPDEGGFITLCRIDLTRKDNWISQ